MCFLFQTTELRLQLVFQSPYGHRQDEDGHFIIGALVEVSISLIGCVS